jgi:hypothetical protein
MFSVQKIEVKKNKKMWNSSEFYKESLGDWGEPHYSIFRDNENKK